MSSLFVDKAKNYLQLLAEMRRLRFAYEILMLTDKDAVCSTNHVHGKYDLLVWFEVLELAPSGE